MDITTYKKEGFDFIKIINDKFEVILSDFGASVYCISLDGRYMTQTPVDVKDFISNKGYMGKTIGRVGNRIKGNFFELDGERFYILNNEGENTLHGGVDGLSTKKFEYKIFEDDDETSIIFSYLSKDGESGFPGNLLVKIKYTIFKGRNDLLISFTASSDRRTLCSLTNHSYYCVGEKSLDTVKLLINASYYLHTQKEDLLPIEKKEVTPFLDFRKEKLVTKDINHPILLDGKANGYDHHFYFDDLSKESLKSKLIGKDYTLSIYSDFSGMQIYSCNYPSDTKFYQLEGKIHQSLAMEPQDDFLNINIINEDEEYHRYILLSFTRN